MCQYWRFNGVGRVPLSANLAAKLCDDSVAAPDSCQAGRTHSHSNLRAAPARAFSRGFASAGTNDPTAITDKRTSDAMAVLKVYSASSLVLAVP